MSAEKPSVVPGMAPENSAFPHLTTIESQALHHLVAVSGAFGVTSLLRSATLDQQRQTIQEVMERKLAEAKRQVPTSMHSLRNDAVKIETSTYSDVEQVLPTTARDQDSVMAVIDPLMKRVHFVTGKGTATTTDIALRFHKDIFRLRGLSSVVVSDRDIKITSSLWKKLCKLL
ncbi:unnamed protein product [Phytophthora fragariaefolia]|uniref:Unnamed protein product n=1 Tax=Phytophthora fragariaefolia TaxID=1490495 RepID=A0A9W6XK33_9STRA|nr:unnamed protein product [Phytophthora fragariaefolia]